MKIVIEYFEKHLFFEIAYKNIFKGFYSEGIEKEKNISEQN
tara:strand:+ start:2027 stop:2149 length:123 start_codon:yes stop_codon:yes gene_type:complete